jgi:hypothetical protein
MDTRIAQLLDKEISRREAELAALKQARQALSGAGTHAGASGTKAAGRSRRGRRNFTAAQRAAISKRMKATWAKRRAAKKAGKAA